METTARIPSTQTQGDPGVRMPLPGPVSRGIAPFVRPLAHFQLQELYPQSRGPGGIVYGPTPNPFWGAAGGITTRAPIFPQYRGPGGIVYGPTPNPFWGLRGGITELVRRLRGSVAQ